MMRLMKKHALMLVVFVLSVWVVGGCSSDGNPVASGEIVGDLFPFGVGRIWVSTAYDLDTTGQKIEASTHREVLYAKSAVSFAGKSAFLMIDSVYATSGQLSFVDSTYMATENGDFFLYSFGSWLSVFKKSEGLNKEYVAGTIVITDFGFPVPAEVKGKIYPKETVVTPKGNMEAYKLEIKFSISFGSIAIEEILNVWFADGVGPVKFQTPPVYDPLFGRTINGRESVLVSTNF